MSEPGAAPAVPEAIPEEPPMLAPGAVLGLLRCTIPLHVALPVAWWFLAAAHDGWVTLAFGLIHVGFPVVLGVTYPIWRGRGLELVAVLVLDHIVTFAVFVLLAICGA